MNQVRPAASLIEPAIRHEPVWGRRNPRDIVEGIAMQTRFRGGQEIYAEETRVEAWYRVVSGAARRFAIRADGRRQILDILLPDDMFGFGSRGTHRFTVEAIPDDTVIARYPRARLEALAASDPQLAREVGELASTETSRLQALLLILGRTTAREKVGAFLLHLAERLSGGPSDLLALPISRDEIADHLALSVETVSRALSA